MSTSSWFPYPRTRLAPATLLYCLPCAGAGATIYRGWRDAASPSLQVVPVELPGRGRRFREAPIDDVVPLLEMLTPQLAADAGGARIALFGHSMGAILAFELARALGAQVCHLFVSGSSAPHLRLVKDRSTLSDEALKKELAELGGTPPEILGDAEMMELLLPMLRADFALVESYRGPGDDAALECPVTVFAGEHDPHVDEAAARAWERHAPSGFRFVPIDGGHFYLESAAGTLLAEIARALAGEDGGHRGRPGERDEGPVR